MHITKFLELFAAAGTAIHICCTPLHCLTCCSLSILVSAMLEMCTKPGLAVGSEGTSRTSPRPSSILLTTTSCTEFSTNWKQVSASEHKAAKHPTPRRKHRQRYRHRQHSITASKHCKCCYVGAAKAEVAAATALVGLLWHHKPQQVCHEVAQIRLQLPLLVCHSTRRPNKFGMNLPK